MGAERRGGGGKDVGERRYAERGERGTLVDSLDKTGPGRSVFAFFARREGGDINYSPSPPFPHSSSVNRVLPVSFSLALNESP